MLIRKLKACVGTITRWALQIKLFGETFMSPKMWNTQVSIMLCNDTEISNKEKKEYSENDEREYLPGKMVDKRRRKSRPRQGHIQSCGAMAKQSVIWTTGANLISRVKER
ncbi:unnamed protein product [Gulo gulo]|uniref:Uncharacterized protein n=1 Tax=Gulo gulo TaxID=48420 RepID=A0A9X9PUL6_GULGU|nr:unnamed protein product [Gulo gulo]